MIAWETSKKLDSEVLDLWSDYCVDSALKLLRTNTQALLNGTLWELKDFKTWDKEKISRFCVDFSTHVWNPNFCLVTRLIRVSLMVYYYHGNDRPVTRFSTLQHTLKKVYKDA